VEAQLHSVEARAANGIAAGQIHPAWRIKLHLDNAISTRLQVVKAHHVPDAALGFGLCRDQAEPGRRVVVIGIPGTDIATLGVVDGEKTLSMTSSLVSHKPLTPLTVAGPTLAKYRSPSLVPTAAGVV